MSMSAVADWLSDRLLGTDLTVRDVRDMSLVVASILAIFVLLLVTDGGWGVWTAIALLSLNSFRLLGWRGAWAAFGFTVILVCPVIATVYGVLAISFGWY